MKRDPIPPARDVRENLLQVCFGPYVVSYDPKDQAHDLPLRWRVHGPRDTEGMRGEPLDVFDTYRQACADARARSRGEFGETRGDDARGRTIDAKAARHRRAASTYPFGSEGARYHEGEAILLEALLTRGN
jgi:hypothetical protein